MSVKSTMPFESHHSDSSDTDKYPSEDDEDDDVLMLHEERKSLFSALKNRMHAVDSNKNSTEHSSRIQADRVASYCKESYSSQKKRAVKGKRTSSIVSLSFSDDDDDDDLCVREKSDHVINLHVSSTSETQTACQVTDCIVVEPYKSQNDKTTYQKNRDASNVEYHLKQGTKFVASPISDHDTDSCEDSDDFPCVLPSTCRSSQSETSSTSQSLMPDLSSGRQTDPQDSSEIPVKRKKRTTEEIISQRNEALVGNFLS